MCNLPSQARVRAVNAILAKSTFHSTNRLADYHKLLTQQAFEAGKGYAGFLDNFMSSAFFAEYAGLGLSPFVPAEKEINSLTQTAFYSCEMMGRQVSS